MADDTAGRVAGLLGPPGPDIGCDACFDALDLYAELLSAGADADAEERIPGMARHLRGCPACREDLDGLVALLGDGTGGPGA